MSLNARERRAVPALIAERFELDARPEMLNVRALHTADGAPYIFEDRWISFDTVPEILDIDLATQSANEWLVRNKPYSRCDIRFYAVNASTFRSEGHGDRTGPRRCS